MRPYTAQFDFSKKSKKSRIFRKKRDHAGQKTEHSQTEKKSEKFLIPIRFRVQYQPDEQARRFLGEVLAFTSWVYQANYLHARLEAVPRDKQDRLHPHVLKSLLRSFAKKNRRKIQPPPYVLIRGRWITVDVEHRTIRIDPIYRHGAEVLELPAPDIGDTNPESLMWGIVTDEVVELVFGKQPEIVLENCICIPENGGDDDD